MPKRVEIEGLTGGSPGSIRKSRPYRYCERRKIHPARRNRSLLRWFLLGFLMLFAGASVMGGVVAYTNPELIDFFNAVATAGLNGLKAYFDFLLDLVDKFLPYLV